MLLTTALFRALHEHFPSVQVDALIYQETTPLLENNPHLRQIFCINRKLKGRNRLKAELKLILQIRRGHYDAVIHLTDQWVGAVVTLLSKAPLRVQLTQAKRDKALWHACFNRRVAAPPRGYLHAVELNLLCLQVLGIDPSSIHGEPMLHPSADNLKKVDQLLAEHHIHGPFALIHPAARWPFKCWGNDQFAQVIAHLLNQNLNVVLTCSPDPVELEMTHEIERLAREIAGPLPNKLINMGGKTHLPLLAALLTRCQFYVGVDSAPMHMAAALNVPQVALFGPSWVQEWRPWSSKAIVIYAGDFGTLPHPDSINTDDPTRLLTAIPTEVVIQAVNKLL